MSRRINNTSGGLFAAFSPTKELKKDSKSAVETQIVVSKKKGNSRVGKIKATVTDSLALIQAPTDGQIKQPTLSKKRGRSRPREIKPNEEQRSKANRIEAECSIPTKACHVLPRRNRYNPPRVLHKSFKTAAMSRSSNPQSNFVSEPSISFEGSIRAIKTNNLEVLKTPSKRSNSDALDTQKNTKLKLVTPSPKVKRKKSSNTSSQSSDISEVSSKGRNNKARRVSSVNGAAKKKKRVELAKAVSVGKVTIPAREVEKSTRKTNNGKIIKATKADIKSLALTETNKSYQMSKVQREEHGLTEFTTKSFEGSDSDRKDQLSTSSFEGDTKDKDLTIHRRINSSKSKDIRQPKGGSFKIPRNGRKSKLMSFIDDAIDDLKELKNEIERMPVSDLVKIEELRRMYEPLTRQHLLVDKQLKNKVKTKSSVQTFGFKASKTNYSTTFPLFNNSCKDNDEDSSCDSVIDFGIISDSKAIVSYSQQDDGEDCQSKAPLKNDKAKESRSRIQSNSVGILASLSAPPTQETSVVATLATRNIKDRRDKSSSKRESRIGLVHTSKNEKTEKETRIMPEKEQVDSQQLNQFQKLFAMNHDELLGIEMKSRLDKLSQKDQRKKKGKIFPNRDASKDDLFDLPAIAF